MTRKAAIILITLGVVLHSYINIFKSSEGIYGFNIGLLIYSLLPYFVCALFITIKNKPQIALGGVILPLIIDSITYYDVFINPQSSTAALGLLFTPLVNLIIFMPIGILIGFGISRSLSRKASNN